MWRKHILGRCTLCFFIFLSRLRSVNFAMFLHFDNSTHSCDSLHTNQYFGVFWCHDLFIFFHIFMIFLLWSFYRFFPHHFIILFPRALFDTAQSTNPGKGKLAEGLRWDFIFHNSFILRLLFKTIWQISLQFPTLQGNRWREFLLLRKASCNSCLWQLHVTASCNSCL